MVYMICDRCGKKMTNVSYFGNPFLQAGYDPNVNSASLPKYIITKGGATGPLQSINLCPDCENALDDFIFEYKNLCAISAE